MINHRSIRRAAGWSVTKTAAMADVSPGLVRIFEMDPEEVKDVSKRLALLKLYDGLKLCGSSCSA